MGRVAGIARHDRLLGPIATIDRGALAAGRARARARRGGDVAIGDEIVMETQ